jgi:hypothetical protein
MTSTFSRKLFLSHINIISNKLESNLANEDYSIFEDLNYLYSLLSPFSLAFIFTNGYENINNIDKKNILSVFSSSNTLFDKSKIQEHNINDKESIDYILYIIDDMIDVYKYPENQIHFNDENTLSINPFLFVKNDEFNKNNVLEEKNDKIINVLNEVKSYLKKL